METCDMIKFLRIKKKLTQDELGVILGVKKSAIQKYESGAVQNLKMETLKRLCNYFGVPPYIFVYPEKISDPEHASEFFADLQMWDNLHIAKLNVKGRERLRTYVEDIMKIEEYLKPSQDGST